MDLLAIHQKAKGDDDNQGPSLTSQNRDERILARRLRVDQRIIQKRRKIHEIRLFSKTLGIVSPTEDEHKDEASLAKDQTEQSRQRLVKLEEDGLEFV
jgi:hypothetical protein